MVAVGRQPAQIRRPRLDQLRPPVRQVRRNLNPHVRHQPPALPNQPLDVVDRDGRRPLGHRQTLSRFLLAAPPTSRCLVGDLGYLATVVARMGDEVLQDHLLQVAVALMQLRQRFERGDPLLLGLPDADQDAAGEGDLQLAGGLDRRQPLGGVLGRRAGVDGLHQPLGDRLQHQPLRSGDLAQPRQVLAVEHADVRVGQDAALQRPLAGPDDVGGEVLVAPLRKTGSHLRVHLGPLAGEDQELLGIAPQRLVQPPFDLLGRVDVGAVRGERAVLAVALAGAREGERVVPREGDPAHAAQATETAGPAGPGGSGRSSQSEDSGFGASGSGFFGAEAGLTRSGGSVGAGPPGSSTNLNTAAASREPTIGPTR